MGDGSWHPNLIRKWIVDGDGNRHPIAGADGDLRTRVRMERVGRPLDTAIVEMQRVTEYRMRSWALLRPIKDGLGARDLCDGSSERYEPRRAGKQNMNVSLVGS